MEPLEHQQNIKPRDPETETIKTPIDYGKALEEHEKNKADDPIKQLRTYQGDVAEAIKKDNVSVIKIALAEKRRQEREGYQQEDLSPQSKKNIWIIGISVFLVLLSLGLIGYFYFIHLRSSVPQSVAVAHDLIFVESKENVPITSESKDALVAAINTERDAPIALGSIKSLLFTSSDGSTTSPVSLSEFLSLLQVNAPGSLIRSFDGEYVYGIYGFNPHSPFLLIKVSDYENAYAGMISWEPYMKKDIGPLFIYPSDDIIATSSTSTNSFSVTPFADSVVENSDARVLTNANGDIILLYTFIDKNTLLIASNDQTLKEVKVRLTVSQVER